MNEKQKGEDSVQVLEPKLAKLVDSSDDSETKYSVILQCELPKRVFKLSSNKFKPAVLERLPNEKGSKKSRENLFEEFIESVQEIIGDEKLNAFKTSGSIAVKLTAEQIKLILARVKRLKEIRTNRKLRKS